MGEPCDCVDKPQMPIPILIVTPEEHAMYVQLQTMHGKYTNIDFLDGATDQ